MYRYGEGWNERETKCLFFSKIIRDVRRIQYPATPNLHAFAPRLFVMRRFSRCVEQSSPFFFFASSISHHTPPFHILHAVCALFRRHDGTVTWDGLECPQGMQIEGTGVHRINGNLAVARAIGDVDCRPWVSGEVPPS